MEEVLMMFIEDDEGVVQEVPVPSKEERAHVYATSSRAQLRAYQDTYQLLLLRGRLYTVAEYPCQCEMMCPGQCAHARELRRDFCGCPCHTYWQGY